jgi:hypothetical protein
MSLSMLSRTRTGTLSFDGEIDSTALPAHLADSLRDAHASTVETQGNCVTFTRRMFRFLGNWNVLVPFETGNLIVDADARQIRYSLSIRQLVLFGTATVAVMSAFMLMSPVWQPLLAMPVIWLWLVGANAAIGIYRFEMFVSRTVASAPRLTQQST